MATKALKPQRAVDLDFAKIKYPVIVSAKIDGVRGINLTGTLQPRTLKQFKNPFVVQRYSGESFTGCDGELAFGKWTDQDLCRKTSGFVGRKAAKIDKKTKEVLKPIEGNITWWLFDFVRDDVVALPYIDRLRALEVHFCVEQLGSKGAQLVPWKIVNCEEELLAQEAIWLDVGFEGLIARNPQGKHKDGYATVTTGDYLRLKRFIDFEGVIVNIIEAMENTNEAVVNALGRTERSTAQAGKVPKGMVGMLQYKLLADVEFDGRVLFKKDDIVDVGPGEMPHDERKRLFENQGELLGQIGKAKFFPKGVKDKPRFPTHQSIRLPEDL